MPSVPNPLALNGEVIGAGVVDLVASVRYTALVSDGGALFTFGAGTHGVLGHGDTDDRPTPTRVGFPPGGGATPTLPRVVQVSCGSLYMAAVTADGRLYTWGYLSVPK